MTDDGTKQFYLLNLPSVASGRIIKQMTLMELFKLSLTTKKTRKAIKSSFTKNFFHILFSTTASTLGIELKNEKNGSIQKFTGYLDHGNCEGQVFLGEYKVENDDMKIFQKPDGNIVFYWFSEMNANSDTLTSNNQKGMRSCIHYFLYFLNNPIVSLSTSTEWNFSFEIMEYAKKLNLQWKDVSCFESLIHPENYKYLLNSFQEINNLSIWGDSTKQWLYNPPNPNTFKLNYLFVRYPDWMKLEDFMQCKKIHLQYVKRSGVISMCMTPQYLNSFLKKWKATDSRMEYLNIQFLFEIDFFAVVEGLATPENKNQQHTSGHYLKIQHNDGKKAVVYNWYKDFYLHAGIDDETVARIWNNLSS